MDPFERKNITVNTASLRMSLLMMLVVALATKGSEGQMPTQSCVMNLILCAEYFGSTKPPESCCTPLKDAVLHQLDCLCNLHTNQALLKSFSIDEAQALLLLRYCGIPANVSACKAMPPGSSAPSGIVPEHLNTTSTTVRCSGSGAAPRGNNQNGVGRIASAAGLLTFILFGASLIMFW